MNWWATSSATLLLLGLDQLQSKKHVSLCHIKNVRDLHKQTVLWNIHPCVECFNRNVSWCITSGRVEGRERFGGMGCQLESFIQIYQQYQSEHLHDTLTPKSWLHANLLTGMLVCYFCLIQNWNQQISLNVGLDIDQQQKCIWKLLPLNICIGLEN